MMHTEMKSGIFIFSESFLQLICCKEFQDRFAFVSHWLSVSYQMILQLLQFLQHTDVPVFEVKEKLEAMSNAQSKEELASCFKDFKERFVISYNKFLIKRSHKADLLEKVSHYYVTTRQLKAIQQFTSGLFSYSLLSSLRKFKAQAEKEFIYSPYPITSKYLQNLYTFEFTVSRDENLKHKEQKHCIQLV